MSNAINTTALTATTNTAALAALTADIRRYPMLTVDEEIEKFEEYATASESRREQLRSEIACANLRFALSVAKKYSNDGNTVAELVSLATIGLYRAIDTFDLSKGFRFISHAVFWIRAEFSEYFRGDANFVRRSNNAKVGSKERAIRERFFQTEMREPSEEEILAALKEEYGIVLTDKIDVIRVRTNSLDERVSSEEEATVGEVGEIALATATRNGYEEESEREDTEYRVRQLLDGLSVREQEIVCRKFGIGFDREYELDEIAEALDYPNERVRQILAQALVKMKGRNKALSALVG